MQIKVEAKNEPLIRECEQGINQSLMGIASKTAIALSVVEEAKKN